jgi:di/tricarboxylate transporter
LIVVAVLSAFIKNIGALAIMMPVAFQFSRRSGKSPSPYLMPMSSAVLLGGLTTRIGTSPNIVVSRLREEITGALADLRGEDGNFLLLPICRPTAATTTRKYSGFARREGLVVHR